MTAFPGVPHRHDYPLFVAGGADGIGFILRPGMRHMKVILVPDASPYVVAYGFLPPASVSTEGEAALQGT